jgi:hypothetical protein
LQNTAGRCACDLQIAKAESTAPEFSRLATTEEIQQQRDADLKKAAPPPPPPEKPAATKEEPVYQVYMPPLSYDAKATVQADNFDPKLILLVRRVRVRPTLIFQGRVEGSAAPAPAQTAAKAMPPPAAAPTQSDDSVYSRVRAFFRRLFS